MKEKEEGGWMKVLVVGQGGREHALVRAIKRSRKVEMVYCAPGNGGIEQDAICLPVQESDFQGLVESVRKYQIDLTVVGPENPLFAGIVDFFKSRSFRLLDQTKQLLGLREVSLLPKN